MRDEDLRLIDERTEIAVDLLAWMDRTNHADYPIILFNFLGLRRAELLGLTWDRIDFAKSEIHIQQQLMRAKGKGWWIEPRTKNKKARTLFLDTEWWSVIISHRASTSVEIPDRDNWQDELVFRRADGQNYTYTDWDKLWRRVLSEYQGAERPGAEELYWRPHYNRHITASLFFRAGESLEYVRELLGHTDETMSRYYTHFMRDAKQAAMESYGKALRKADWGAISES